MVSVFRAAGGLLGGNEAVEGQDVDFQAEHFQFHGLSECPTVIAHPADLAQEIKVAVIRGQGEVQSGLEGENVEAERQTGRRARKYG